MLAAVPGATSISTYGMPKVRRPKRAVSGACTWMRKYSSQQHPYPDAWKFVHALIDANTPQNLVWASDWPFLRAPARIDYGPIVSLFEQLIPDTASRHAIQWETPKRLFGFEG